MPIRIGFLTPRNSLYPISKPSSKTSVGPSTCLDICRLTCEVGIALAPGKWNNVAISTLLRILLRVSWGKNLIIYAVVISSTFLVKENLNPLLRGESNSEKAAIIFFNNT